MPKYRYIVINQENKQLNGTIGAPDEQSARQELNELGFSVISINLLPEESVEEDPTVLTFEFAAIDKNQKKVIGTIQAQDRYMAYKRLVNEYTFEVEYVIANELPETEKVQERKKGTYDLQQQLDKEAVLNPKGDNNNRDEKELKDLAEKQEVLRAQIDFVLHKVKEMLDLYEHDMKPEVKDKIRQFVNKILRIRTSTNIEYIRKTAEELLTYLQKEELFLNEEMRLKERTHMIVEAKNMMMQLHKAKNQNTLNFHESLRKWRKENITNNPSPSLRQKTINFFVSLFIGFNNEAPEILEVKKEIELINQQILQYLQLYFQATSPEVKIETKGSLKNLWSKRKKLKQQLKNVKNGLQQAEVTANHQTHLEKIAHELLTFSGWILTFYLIYYFCSIYLISKDLSGLFGDFHIPGVFYIYTSSFLKYFLTTTFLLHSFLSIKAEFFRKNELASLIMIPIFLLSITMIYLNF